MNTPENKAKFFAQYLGQQVFLWKYPKHTINPNYITNIGSLIIEQYANCGSLVLTPLSQITDEDAEVIVMTTKNAARKNHSFFKIWQADYLRSKGYALPYLGITVDQQIEYGWIKLRTA